MFEETQSAVQLELNIQKLNVQKRLKDLNEQVEQLEKRAKGEQRIDKAAEFDPIKQRLFELKKEQGEMVVSNGFKLMYQLGALVETERGHLKELFQENDENASGDSKLQKYMAKLKQRK